MGALAAAISECSLELRGTSFIDGTKVPSPNAAIHALVPRQPDFVATFETADYSSSGQTAALDLLGAFLGEEVGTFLVQEIGGLNEN